jgi:general secretion pathway protein F
MPTFEYKAADLAGKIVQGQLEGKDKAAVISKLQDLQYFPIEVNERVEASGMRREFSLKSFFRRVRSRDILLFTQQLATLVDAGVPLDRSLDILEELNEETSLGPVINKIKRNIQGGSSFADALNKHPRLFGRLYVNMVRSGEKGGVLEVILARLAGFLESSEELKSEIRSAMIYPVLLIVVGGIAMAVLLTFVIPKFAVIFEDVGIALPLSTRIVIGLSTMISQYWYVIIGIIVFSVLLFRKWVATEEGRLKWDAIKLRMPLLGELFRKIEIARFSRTLGTLTRSGVDILQAISIVKDTLTNEVIAKALISVYGGLKEGEGISEPLRQSGVFPSLAVHMIAVGEETGAMEAMLNKVADTYESDVRNTIKRLMSLLEPAMILFMGVIVGFMVVSMLVAIFSITDIAM